MKKKIIVSKKQLNEMRRFITESVDNGYVYIDSGSTLPSKNGLEQVSANGGCPDWRDIEDIEPTTTDDFSRTLCPMRNNRMGMSSNTMGRFDRSSEDDGEVVEEAVEVGSGKMEGIGNDTIGNSELLDTLSDGDKGNDDSVLSQSILSVIDRLLTMTEALPDKKKAMVLNKIIERYDLEEIPYPWKREMSKKIWNPQKNDEFN